MNTLSKTIIVLKRRQKPVSWFLFFLASVLVLSYLLSVNLTVFSTAKRVKINKEINLLNFQVGQLEFELLSKKNEINMNLARSLGFDEARDVRFISRKSVATILGTVNIQ